MGIAEQKTFGLGVRFRKMVAEPRNILPISLGVMITVLIGMALFADVFAPHSPLEISLTDRLCPPFWMDGGSLEYLLGTDQLGRDVLSRVIYGARVSLVVAAMALFFGTGIGATVGLISGYAGGKLDAFLMRAADAAMAVPMILFALLFAVTLGASLTNVVIAVSLVIWARYARIIRGEVLSVKQSDFIAQAKIVGCSPFRIILRHIFPNILNTLMVLVSLQVGWVIIVEASLSFLGAGIPPPIPAWGGMVSEGRQFVVTAWWISMFPGAAIALTVLSFNLFGDWLRDTLDPKLRQV